MERDWSATSEPCEKAALEQDIPGKNATDAFLSAGLVDAVPVLAAWIDVVPASVVRIRRTRILTAMRGCMMPSAVIRTGFMAAAVPGGSGVTGQRRVTYALRPPGA